MNLHINLLTPRQVAQRYALHPHTVSKYLCGAIKIDLPAAFKVGGGWRFREDDVDAHINRLSGRSSAPPAQPQTETAEAFKRNAGRPRKLDKVHQAGGAA